MRRIVVTEFVSLDGVIESPMWTFPYWNDEIAKFKGDEGEASDAYFERISSDRDDETWSAFTEKNGMIWPQYRDKDRKILSAFNIHAFPTYIIIDHEGIVRYQSEGFSWMANLDAAIRKYVKVVARSQ